MRWRVPVEISRDELQALVERSSVVLEREKHRLIHEGDWRRWGARGGREALRRYGPGWFSLLEPSPYVLGPLALKELLLGYEDLQGGFEGFGTCGTGPAEESGTPRRGDQGRVEALRAPS
jgi:hypothetical protein